MKKCLLITLLIVSATACDSEDEKKASRSKSLMPVHVFEYEGAGQSLHIDQNLVTLSSRDQGIYILDASLAERPLEIGQVSLPTVYNSVIKGKTLLGFDDVSGVSAVDLRQLDQLSLNQALSSVELYGYVSDAVWTERGLFVASAAIGLSQYTVDSGANLVGGRVILDSSEDLGATSVAEVRDGLITVSHLGKLHWYVFSEKGELKLRESKTSSYRMMDVACAKSHCFVSALDDGLLVYELNEEKGLELKASIELRKAVEFVYADGDQLLVSYLGTTEGSGWYLFNIKDESSPSFVKEVPSKYGVKSFLTVGDHLYVLNAEKRIEIFKRGALR